MKIRRTALDGVLILEPQAYGDGRGWFLESWNAKAFKDEGINATFVQDNHSHSKQNVLRGLHYQVEQPQGKLVRVTYGEVYDIILDVRKHSLTYGQWMGYYLDDYARQMIWIPPGLAHGYLVLSSCADFLYKATDYYAPQHERTIRWDDPSFSVKLPHNIDPILSEKDANAPRY